MERSVYAPRPFSRQPRSYRSFNFTAQTPALRTFSSLSALDRDDDRNSLASSARSDLAQSDIEHVRSLFASPLRPSTSLILSSLREPPPTSLPDTDTPVTPQHLTLSRHALLDSVDQFSVDSHLSSRTTSPSNMNRYPPPIVRPFYQHNPPPHFSNGFHSPPAHSPPSLPQQSFFDQAPHFSQPASFHSPPQFRSSREEDFLERLKQQRLQAESLNAPYKNGSFHPQFPPPQDRNPHFPTDDYDPWEHRSNNNPSTFNAQQPSNDSTLERAYNRALHKTRSDSHVIPEFHRPPPRFQDQHHQQSAWHSPSSQYTRPFDAFPAYDDLPSPANSEPAHNQRVIPIQIGTGERVLKIDRNDLLHYARPVRPPSLLHQHHQQQQQQHSHIQTSFQPASFREQPMFQSTPQLNHPPHMHAPPPRSSFSPPPSPTRNQTYSVRSPPPIPPPPRCYDGPSTPLSHAHPQPPPRESFSPTREHPLIPKPLHEEILNVIPNRPIRHPPAVARSLQPIHQPTIIRQPLPPPEDPIPHSPVGSQFYNGPSHVKNSAVPLGSVTELGYVDNRGDPLMTASYPGAQHRSYAIVSRPLSPQATIVQPVQPVQPIVHQAVMQRSPLKPPVTISGSEYSAGCAPPVSDPPPREQLFSAECARPPDNGVRSPTQNSTSPIGSVYDNQTDDEPSSPQKFPHSAIPRPTAVQNGNFRTANSNNYNNNRPAGILLKKETNSDTSRIPKKVVFNVEHSPEHEAARKKCAQMGWEDLGLSIYDSGDKIGAESTPGLPPLVDLYDKAITPAVEKLVSASAALNPTVEECSLFLRDLFAAQKDIIWKVAGQKQPEDSQLATAFRDLLADATPIFEKINMFNEKHFKVPEIYHLKAIGEAALALSWIQTKPAPAGYIGEIIDAVRYHTNKIRSEHKQDKAHSEWITALEELLTGLKQYVISNHTRGIVWNANPGSTPTQSGSAAAVPKPGPPGPPGAPPPPPPPSVEFLSAQSAGTDASRALMADLNQGEAITSRLKKVTPEMQTHKNPSLRDTSIVHSLSKTAPVARSQETKPAVVHPPKIEFKDGKQHDISYIVNDNVIINVNDKKETVYIYKCERATITIKGKCTSITMDGCKNTGVVFDAVVCQFETINCNAAQIQGLGEMPTISVQNTRGCQIYLSEEGASANIVTSMSNAINILAPCGEDKEFKEFPVPEQFVNTLVDGKLQTVVSDIC